MSAIGLMGCFHVFGIIAFIIFWSHQIHPGSEWTPHSWRGTTRGGQSASLWRCWAWQRAVLQFLWDAPSTWHNTDRGTATHFSLLYYLQNSTIVAASATVRTTESMSHFLKPWKEHLKTMTSIIKAKINFWTVKFKVIRSCILALKCFLNCTWRVKEIRSMSSAKKKKKTMISVFYYSLKIHLSASHANCMHAKCAIR